MKTQNKVEDKTYNGWTNYETWNVKLWIDNDQGSQEYWNDRASNWLSIAIEEKPFTKEERATLDLMDELKEYFEEQNPLASTATCYTDLLNAALSEVNWYEIAKTIIEDNLAQ